MDRVLETMKESMFFLGSAQNLLKVFLSASALHTVRSSDPRWFVSQDLNISYFQRFNLINAALKYEKS